MITDTISLPEMFWTILAGVGVVVSIVLVHNPRQFLRHAGPDKTSEKLIAREVLFLEGKTFLMSLVSLVFGAYQMGRPQTPGVDLWSPAVVCILTLEAIFVGRAIVSLIVRRRVRRGP